ncbi:predicted protein [Postia placenta Mad-698-R]|nr:predicted protein [Postia placenta Mad-698-R]
MAVGRSFCVNASVKKDAVACKRWRAHPSKPKCAVHQIDYTVQSGHDWCRGSPREALTKQPLKALVARAVGATPSLLPRWIRDTVDAKMNGLYILIPDTSHMLAAEHPPREMSTPALSDDTGSCSSRESSPPATPVSGLSRAPSISFDDYCQHIPTGDGTDIGIVEPDVDYSLPEDISRLLKRGRLADTRTDEVRAERPLPPNICSDASRADDGAFFGLGHIPISDCTSVGDVEPDAVDPSLEYVSRPLKRKQCADTSTYDVRAKRVRTSGTSSDATKAEDRACFGLGHTPIHDYTKSRVVDPDAVHVVHPRIDLYVPPEATARPPKRKRCADPTTDEVRIKRRRLSDSPSDASKLKDGDLFGPHPRCMITGCVSAEVEACYILPPDTPQPSVYTYHVIAEDEHPADSGKPRDDTTTSPVATATSSYRSLGWHDLSANLHLMTVRVGREFIKRPLHYQHLLPIDALVHIPIIKLVHPDVVEPASLHIEQESPVEDIPRPPKRKWCPDTEPDEVPAKRVRTASEASKDGIPFGPHPRCMITGHASAIVRRDLRELWETNRLLMIPHPQHLEDFDYCTVYKYYVIAEDEHPPDSCATMGHPITPSVMTAPCSYRSLGLHELDADLYSMAFRAGRKLSKRPLHYQHILRELLPHKEVNHTYIIIARFPRRFRPIVSGIKRKRSGDTRVDSEACTMKEYAQQVARVRPLAEPEDPELLAYQQEEVKDVVSAVEQLWSDEDFFSSSRAISCISEFISGGGGGMQLRAWRLSGVDTYHLTSDENIRFLLFNERSPLIWPNGVHSPDIKI